MAFTLSRPQCVKKPWLDIVCVSCWGMEKNGSRGVTVSLVSTYVFLYVLIFAWFALVNENLRVYLRPKLLSNSCRLSLQIWKRKPVNPITFQTFIKLKLHERKYSMINTAIFTRILKHVDILNTPYFVSLYNHFNDPLNQISDRVWCEKLLCLWYSLIGLKSMKYPLATKEYFYFLSVTCSNQCYHLIATIWLFIIYMYVCVYFPCFPFSLFIPFTKYTFVFCCPNLNQT